MFLNALAQPFRNFFAPAVIKKPLGLKLQRLFRDVLKAVQLVVLSALFSPMVKGYSYLWRYKITVHPDTQALLDAGEPIIFAMWHNKMYTIVVGLPKENTALLVSQSTDGDMVANIARFLGYRHFVRGSSKRGGATAMRVMLRELVENRHSVMFMLDGPKGPRYKIKPGIVRLAAQTGVPVVQVVSSCKYYFFRLMKNWDRLEFPGIFSPMAIELSQPFYIQPPTSEEEADLTLNKAYLDAEKARLQAFVHENTEKMDLAVHGKSLIHEP